MQPPFDVLAFWSRHPSPPSAQDVIEESFLVGAVQPLRSSVYRYGYEEKIKAAADGEGRRMHLLHTLLVHHFHPVNATESSKTALHFLWTIFFRAQLPILDVLLHDQVIARTDGSEITKPVGNSRDLRNYGCLGECFCLCVDCNLFLPLSLVPFVCFK